MLNNNNYKDEKNTQTAQFFELLNYNKRGACFTTPAILARPKKLRLYFSNEYRQYKESVVRVFLD